MSLWEVVEDWHSDKDKTNMGEDARVRKLALSSPILAQGLEIYSGERTESHNLTTLFKICTEGLETNLGRVWRLRDASAKRLKGISLESLPFSEFKLGIEDNPF